MKKPTKKIKRVLWICEQENCRHVNAREVSFKDYLNDDTCEHCGKRVHEPNVTLVVPT